MELGTQAMEMMWLGALAAPPLALLAAVLCVVGRCRPATRHALWAASLVSFITPAIAGVVWRTSWFQTSRFSPVVNERPESPSAAAREAEAPSSVAALPETSIRSEVHESAHEVASPAPSVRIAESGREDAGRRGVIERARLRSDRIAGRDVAGDGEVERARRDEPERMPIVDERGDPAALAKAAPDFSTTGKSPSALSQLESASPVVAPKGREHSDALSEPGVVAGVPGLSPSPAEPGPSGPSGVGAEAPNIPAAAPSHGSPLAESARIRRANPPGEPAAPGESGETSEPGEPSLLSEWVAHALVVRDAVSAMPPIPVALWWGGAGLVAMVMALRSLTLYRVVRSGRCVSESTRGMIRDAAREMGLTRVPAAVMVDDRVSPMIWCGVRPKLVLPEALWEELDEPSRRAVICHELAHLRRRDHWMCWLETAVRVLYWWHPIAWWACRRVREEADASCDVWVTSLFPRCRRAYAEALIATKSYLNLPGRRVPAGLGVMSNRTKRLARRLTMVMTQKSRPRASAVGTFLALGVIAAGMFVMPGLACPPDEQAKAKSPATRVRVTNALSVAGKGKAVSSPITKKADKECEVTCEVKCEEAPSGQGLSGLPEVTFFGEAPALEAMLGEGGGDEAALRRLEERLRRLEDQLRRLEDKQGSHSTGGPGRPAQGGVFGSTAPGHPSQAPQAIAIDRQAIGEATRQALESARVAIAAGEPARAMEAIRAYAPAASAHAADEVARTLRSYAGAVAPRAFAISADDALVINADGPTHTEEYRLPDGKLKAMIALMEREDVPVFIERHSDKIVVHGTDSQHRVFRAFVKLINPDSADSGRGSSGGSGQTTPAEAARADQKARMKTQGDQLQQRRKEIERRAKDMQKQGDKIRTKADKLRSQAETLNEKAEDLRERAENENNDARKVQLMSQADRMSSQAREVEAQAEAMEAEADAVEQQADAMEHEMDALEEAMSQLEEAAEAMEDAEEAREESRIADPSFSPIAIAPSPLASVRTTPAPVTDPLAPVAVVAPSAPAPPAPPAPPVPPATPAPAAGASFPTQPVPPTPPASPATPAPRAPTATPAPATR